MIKYLFFVFILVFSARMNAQIQTQKKSLEKKKIETPVQETLKSRPEISLLDLTERLPSADRYILDLKSLMNYFIDKKIPADFPLYANEKSFSYNKRKALKWFKKHRELITEERKEWLQLK